MLGAKCPFEIDVEEVIVPLLDSVYSSVPVPEWCHHRHARISILVARPGHQFSSAEDLLVYYPCVSEDFPQDI